MDYLHNFGWQTAKIIFDNVRERIHERRLNSNPQLWQPHTIPAVLDRFDTTMGTGARDEGCRQLGVTAIGEPLLSYTRKAIGTAALAPDGTRSWVKVSALLGTGSHWQREGELSAVDGVPKPRLVTHRTWMADDRHWLALQMGHSERRLSKAATGPDVERAARLTKSGLPN